MLLVIPASKLVSSDPVVVVMKYNLALMVLVASEVFLMNTPYPVISASDGNITGKVTAPVFPNCHAFAPLAPSTCVAGLVAEETAAEAGT